MNFSKAKAYYENIKILRTYQSVLGVSIYQKMKQNAKRVVADLTSMGFRCVECSKRVNEKDFKRADLTPWTKCARCSMRVMDFSRFVETVKK